MKRILLATGFLTIVPLGDMGEVPEEEMGSTTAVFPVVGILEGAFLVILSALFLKVFPTDLTNGLLVLAMVMVNGCLHIDGLADTFDALASRVDKREKLSIMKGSSIGAVGVTAIVFDLLLRYILLNALFFHSTEITYYAILFLMPVISRWTMVSATFYGRPARTEGLGRVFIEHTGLKEMITATVLLILTLLVVFAGISNLSLFLFHCIVVFPLLYIFSIAAVWFSNRQFNGLTGDSLGAVYETAVLLFLIVNVTWLQDFT